MKDSECVAFLQWCLPRLGMRWPGYRRVRRQACKRIGRRLKDLGLTGVAAYRRHLERHPQEWEALDGLCRITVSRFHRDRRVFAHLEREVLPALARRAAARGETVLRCWSAGCASGEEAYTLNILWRLGPGCAAPGPTLTIVATDADPAVLRRARAGCYGPGSLRDVPAHWLDMAFEGSGREYRVRPAFRAGIDFRLQDVRDQFPDGRFHLVLCRNLVFTYFDETRQRDFLERVAARMRRGGALVIGGHESLPAVRTFVPDPGERCVAYRLNGP